MSAALLSLRETLLPTNSPFGYLIQHDAFGYLRFNAKTRHQLWVKQAERATVWKNAHEAKDLSRAWNKTKIVRAPREPKQRALEEESEEEEAFSHLLSAD